MRNSSSLMFIQINKEMSTLKPIKAYLQSARRIHLRRKFNLNNEHVIWADIVSLKFFEVDRVL